MDIRNTAIQLRAGIFMLFGLLCVGSLVIYFGRFGESVKKYYLLQVEYKNASGLLQGSDVLLSGAKIGNVAKPPTILPKMKGVLVSLKIDHSIQIPQGSIFSIGSSGLLGDRYVSISMNDKLIDPRPITPGSVITNGMSEASITELQCRIHDEILPKVSAALDNIDALTTTLRQNIFNKSGVDHLQLTMNNLAVTSTKFKEAAGQAKVFLAKSTGTIESLQQATDDLTAFSRNLRRHGIIFYRDTPIQQPISARNRK